MLRWPPDPRRRRPPAAMMLRRRWTSPHLRDVAPSVRWTRPSRPAPPYESLRASATSLLRVECPPDVTTLRRRRIHDAPVPPPRRLPDLRRRLHAVAAAHQQLTCHESPAGLVLEERPRPSPTQHSSHRPLVSFAHRLSLINPPLFLICGDAQLDLVIRLIGTD